MPYNAELAGQVRRHLAGRWGIVEKKMFGGLCFLRNGNICCGVWKEFLILRLGLAEALRALEEPGVRPFDITGRPMKGWVMVAADEVQDEEICGEWIERAHRFVRTLPTK